MKQFVLPLLSIILITFTACEDVIEVKLSKENLGLYAVEAKITTEDNPYVYFYKGPNVDDDTAYPGISGATVTISDDGHPSKSILLVEGPAQKGFYHVPENQSFLGRIGKEYTVTIEYGGVTLTGKDKLSRVEPIDLIQVMASLRGDKRFLGIYTYGNESPGVGDYYKWDIYINGVLLNGAENIIVVSDEQVDGNYVKGFEIFTDFHDPKKEEDRKLKFMDTVVVKQTSISKQAYLFYYQMHEQSMAGGLYSVPPANIKGNFSASNGKTVLGIFTAHDVSTSNVVVIDESIESQLNKKQ